MRRLTVFGVLLALAVPAAGQLYNPPSGGGGQPVDTSNFATKSEVQTAQTTANNAQSAVTTLAAQAVKSVNAATPDGSGNVALSIPTTGTIASQISAATADLATTSALSAVQAAIPVAAGSVPPMETSTTGVVGSAGTYRPATAVAPRITRAAIVTTTAGGVGSITWSTALPTAPAVILTPVNATSSIDCQLTSAPTTTTVAFRCFTAQTTTLNLTIVTAGLTLNPVANSAAGLQVHVLAIPTTQ